MCGSQDTNILNFIKILLKLGIVSKIYIFCPPLSSTTITGQRNFLSVGHGLLDKTSGTKTGFEFFLLRSGKLLFLILPSFFNDLFSNEARKLEVAESNRITEHSYLSFSLSVTVSFRLFPFHILSLSLYLSFC